MPSWWASLDRRRLAVALGSTLVAVPVVVVDNLPSQHATRAEAEERTVEAGAAAAPVELALPSSTTVTVEVETTTTTEPPVETTTTAAPTTTTTAAPRPTTTTTAPPPPPTTAAPAPAGNTESGQATWYRYRDGECAHKTLPRGTVVTVTNVANGASATCVVTDRGPFGGNRIIDLDDGTFAQLAPLSTGVIDVVIAW